MISTTSIEVNHRYLHIPVRFDAPLGLMRVFNSGEQVLKFATKIAITNPDYFVFADFDKFLGQTVELSFESKELTDSDISNLYLKDELPELDISYKERYRPQCHFSSQRGYINDPNGLIFYEDTYHLFYQHQPFGTDIGYDLKFWGHAVSQDLIHWRELPSALAPDEHGAMYSGSAVVDWNNTSGFGRGGKPPLVALYTADGRSADDERPFTQCLAYSNDNGLTWNKYSSNPVLPHIAGLNRDPRIFWFHETKCWIMVLYLDGDRFLILTSENLIKWTMRHEFELPSHSCPDLFQLALDDNPNDLHWVFWSADTRYVVGTFDGLRFTSKTEVKRQQLLGTAYAAQTWSDIPDRDGRTLQMSWLRTNANGMPFTHCMTLPYELTLRTTQRGIELCSNPVEETKILRRNESSWKNLVMDPKELPNKMPCLGLPTITNSWGIYPLAHVSNCVDIEATINIGSATSVAVKLRGIYVVYDHIDGSIYCQPRLGRNVNISKVPADIEDGILDLRILLDRISIEIFAARGAVVIPLGIVPKDDDNELAVAASGGRAIVESLNLWNLSSIWHS